MWALIYFPCVTRALFNAHITNASPLPFPPPHLPFDSRFNFHGQTFNRRETRRVARASASKCRLNLMRVTFAGQKRVSIYIARGGLRVAIHELYTLLRTQAHTLNCVCVILTINIICRPFIHMTTNRPDGSPFLCIPLQCNATLYNSLSPLARTCLIV